MQITGEWLLCDDGITRPIVRIKVHGSDGQWHADRFLIDSGADRSAFSAELLGRSQWHGAPAPLDWSLQGIGGKNTVVVVDTVLLFTRPDGDPARVRGQFAAFTDPAATDISILGRDVLNHFDLILSRPRNEILFLFGNHRYVIQQV